MNKERVKELALANGFKLKEQPDGSMDLHPYVFTFAEALIAEAIATEVSKLWQPLTQDVLRRIDTSSQLLRNEKGEVFTGFYQERSTGGDYQGFMVKGVWHNAREFTEIHDPELWTHKPKTY